MAPSPQESVLPDKEITKEAIQKPLTGDEVVISGMSGIFPKSNSIAEFMENLYNEVDMVTDEDPRWIFNHPEVPKHLGKVSGMGKFDAQFFRVHYKQACTMEPMSRKLLEHAYSAIYDSGINPLQLRGTKVGVFIGSTFSESEKIVIYENIQRNGFGITGCNKAMYANRISYWIDGKGPSYALDVACASSMACLEHAFRSISSGECDAAIVGGCNLCMHPNVSLNLKRAGFLCLDGKTKCFDKNGDGYVRSDAISVLFLQKAKDAKRIYSQVYHAQGMYSTMPNAAFLPVRESKDIQEFLENFYSGIDVSPDEIEYVEAYGAALAAADGNELEAIGKVFGKDKPVMVGCVKSNMGHSEPASGACAVTKVCLAYHKGKLPANLHYSEPQDDVPSVYDGKVKILQEKSTFNRGFTALNSFSYSGVNIHVLLKGLFKAKKSEQYKSSIPRLITISGRQESCVSHILSNLKSQPIDAEQIGLLHSIHENDIPGHMCRGYTILDYNNKNETVCLAQKADYFTGESRPIWFVYSGMGSQWAGMGSELMKIPPFAAAIHRLELTSLLTDIKLPEFITEITFGITGGGDADKTIYNNILNSFVGIAAVQIGLTDVLKELGIVPDNIIGHSVGELGCAYADGCFTAEEMILSAYSRGLVSIQSEFIHGSMAAVGLGYKTILPLCPPEIEVACHNSFESSTISGPSDAMKIFVAELTSRGIFAKEVPCSNIAYHSRYIANAGSGLLKYLSEVIKNPKLRSKKWVSTSVPQDKWNEPSAKYSSAEYHTNNLLNAVLFEETAKLIPDNALVIEIAPHGLLQAILKRSHTGCTHVPLTRRGNSNPVQFFLEAVGKLYQEGLNPKVKCLYPKIQYPVSTETPLLSHFVKWEHTENWPQAKYNTKSRVTATAREFIVSIHDDDYKNLEGYVRDDVLVFSEAAMLVLVWETLAMQQGIDYRDMSVVFSDVNFHGEAIIKSEIPLRLGITIHKGNHRFEVNNCGVNIVSGFINRRRETFRTLEEIKDEGEDDDILLSANDVYKILHLRGFSFKNEFMSIQSVNSGRTKANIRWNNIWAAFLDSLLQFNILARNHDGISIPKFIKKISIDTNNQENIRLLDEDVLYYKAELSHLYGVTRCAGVEIDTIFFHDIAIVEKELDVLETRTFIPHFMTGEINIDAAVLINLQLVTDNVPGNVITVTNVTGIHKPQILEILKEVCNKIPGATFAVNSMQDVDNVCFNKLDVNCNVHILLVENLLNNYERMKNLHKNLTENTFVLTYEDSTTNVYPRYKYFNVITAMPVKKKTLALLNSASLVQKDDVIYIHISHDNFSWISRVKSELKKRRRVGLVSERQTYCGLLGLVKRLNKEHDNKLKLFIVDDYLAPLFNPDHEYYKQQIVKNLTVNVMKKGQWGGYYYLPSTKSSVVDTVKLSYNVPGDINSFTWMEAPPSPESNVKVQVFYTGPSLRDAEKVIGIANSQSKTFGMDYSGINQRGERVMGIISEGAISSTVVADPDLLWPVPHHWSLEDAATVILPFIHAYYSFAMIHPVLENHSVFINGGAGAFGQAVISICLSINCSVYTTVNSVQKKRFLLRMFSKLKAENIIYSRHDTFCNMVLKNTGGKKCNYVLSTLSGPLREAAMKCVGFAGIFVDVSDSDMMKNRDFGMSYLLEERNYKAVNISNLFKPENVSDRKMLQLLIAEGIAKGIVKPLSRVVYSPRNVSKAFRLLASNNNMGRVLIRMRDPTSSSLGLNVKPIMNYSSQDAYVIVCDDNGMGVEIADRLVRKGAMKLIIHLKCSAISAYFRTKVTCWKRQNVFVVTSSVNLQTEEGCNNLLVEGGKLAPIHGIFIFVDSSNSSFEQDNLVTKFNETGLVVANLDSVSRNVCAELKYFSVTSHSSQSAVDAYAESLIENICEMRCAIGLPGLMLRVNQFNEIIENADNLSIMLQPQTLSATFSALETSLKLKYENVRAYDLEKPKDENFLEKIAVILGAKNINDLPQKQNLKELDVTDVNLEEIKAILKQAHEIHYPKETLELMTISSLRSLGNEDSQNTKFDAGLGAFYTFIDEDECMATEPMVAMPTKLSNATEKEEELDPKETYLILIPGFEGHHQVFLPICERLKILAMTFQLGPDILDNSIQEMAVNIMTFMKKRFELKSKFYLLGFSFGVNVALELAVLMEKEGRVGIVYCLDSSPDALRVHLDAYLGNLSESELQNTIVEHMYRLMAGKESEDLKEDLNKFENWNDKVEACVNRLRGLVNYSHQYKRLIIQSAYNRIKLVKEYQPTFQLRSELVLMKGIAHPKADKLPDDYNLSKYSRKPVKIYNLVSDHASAPNDCRVSNFINRFLEPKLLEEFEKRNLCETYLADPFKIL